MVHLFTLQLQQGRVFSVLTLSEFTAPGFDWMPLRTSWFSSLFSRVAQTFLRSLPKLKKKPPLQHLNGGAATHISQTRTHSTCQRHPSPSSHTRRPDRHTSSPRLRLHFTEFSPFIVSPWSPPSPSPPRSPSLLLFSELLFALCHRPFTDLAPICPLCSIAPLYRDKIAQNFQTRLLLFCAAASFAPESQLFLSLFLLKRRCFIFWGGNTRQDKIAEEEKCVKE